MSISPRGPALWLRNPLVMVAAGVLMGLCLGLILGTGVLLILDADPDRLAPPSISDYDIQAIVEEDYINRIMVESANEMSGPVSLTAGEMDIKPGAVADFDVELEIGPLHPVFEGTVGFRATDDGSSIEVLLLDAQVGRLRLNRLVPDGALDSINEDIKRLLVDKIGSKGLSVLYVESDDTTLRLGFGRTP
ncbi:MAG: hypothetical protein ACP5JG_06985 [Anaerolineae bacterium]